MTVHPLFIQRNSTFKELLVKFGLTRFEGEVLGWCVAVARGEEVRSEGMEKQGKPYPTFVAALRMFEGAHGDALAPHRPLRYWKLIDVIHAPELPPTLGALRVDERILHYAQGVNYLDERLQAYLLEMTSLESLSELPSSQAELVAHMVATVREATDSQAVPVLQVSGIDAASKQVVVQQVATELGARLFRLPVDLIPKRSDELDLFARLWEREGALWPVALYLEAHELDVETQAEQVKVVQRFLARSGGLFFLSTRSAWNKVGVPVVTFDVTKPTTAEQEALWVTQLGTESGEIPARLAAQFNLGVETITQVGAAMKEEEKSLERVWEGCLVQTRPGLDTLAQRIIPKATWRDIVLPQAQMAQLLEIAAQVENRGKVYDAWGWRDKVSRGLGMTVLFGGESGTGKTFSAEILANHLHLNLYRIDLSQVVSKYIGETEKNLRKLFDAAEDGGAILFFDEADALFGKRSSEARSSNDRYANMETAYLLQRLEQYQGLAILTTNLLNNIDEAFMRRVRFVVNFPVPDDLHRNRIWRRIFPAGTPLGQLDYRHLARFKMAGGSIYNAALNASFRAAKEESQVEMPHILEAVRLEFDKGGRLPQPQLFVWPPEETDKYQ